MLCKRSTTFSDVTSAEKSRRVLKLGPARDFPTTFAATVPCSRASCCFCVFFEVATTPAPFQQDFRVSSDQPHASCDRDLGARQLLCCAYSHDSVICWFQGLAVSKAVASKSHIPKHLSRIASCAYCLSSNTTGLLPFPTAANALAPEAKIAALYKTTQSLQQSHRFSALFFPLSFSSSFSILVMTRSNLQLRKQSRRPRSKINSSKAARLQTKHSCEYCGEAVVGRAQDQRRHYQSCKASPDYIPERYVLPLLV